MSEIWEDSAGQNRRVTYSEAASIIQKARNNAELTKTLRDKVVENLIRSTESDQLGDEVTWAVYGVLSNPEYRDMGEEDRQILLAYTEPDQSVDSLELHPVIRVGAASTIESNGIEELLVEGVVIDPNAASSHRIDLVSLSAEVEYNDDGALIFWIEDDVLETIEPLDFIPEVDMFEYDTRFLGKQAMSAVSFFDPNNLRDIENALRAGIRLVEEIGDAQPLGYGYQERH